MASNEDKVKGDYELVPYDLLVPDYH